MSDNKLNAVVWRLFYAVGQQEAGSLVLCPLRWVVGGGYFWIRALVNSPDRSEM